MINLCHVQSLSTGRNGSGEVHNRMPVILEQESVSVWLSDPMEQAIKLCRPWRGDVQIDWSDDRWSWQAT